MSTPITPLSFFRNKVKTTKSITFKPIRQTRRKPKNYKNLVDFYDNSKRYTIPVITKTTRKLLSNKQYDPQFKQDASWNIQTVKSYTSSYDIDFKTNLKRIEFEIQKRPQNIKFFNLAKTISEVVLRVDGFRIVSDVWSIECNYKSNYKKEYILSDLRNGTPKVIFNKELLDRNTNVALYDNHSIEFHSYPNIKSKF